MNKKRKPRTIKNGNYLFPIGLMFCCIGAAFLLLTAIDGFENSLIMASLFLIIGVILLGYNVATLSNKK